MVVAKHVCLNTFYTREFVGREWRLFSFPLLSFSQCADYGSSGLHCTLFFPRVCMTWHRWEQVVLLALHSMKHGNGDFLS